MKNKKATKCNSLRAALSDQRTSTVIAGRYGYKHRERVRILAEYAGHFEGILRAFILLICKKHHGRSMVMALSSRS